MPRPNLRNTALYLPFQPSQIGGLQIWFDGADPASIEIGTGVSQWRDKSGFGRHASQSNGGNQPTYAPNARFGKSAIAFSDDWLYSPANYTLGSLIVVWDSPAANAAYDGVVSMRIGGEIKSGTAASSMNWNMGLLTNNNVFIQPFPSGVECRLNRVLQPAAINDFASGVPIRTSPDRWNMMVTVFDPNSGAKNIVIGADIQQDRTIPSGHVAEVIGYDRRLTSEEIVRIETYLSQKWNLP